MNKQELIRAVAEQTGMSAAQAEVAVNATLTAIGRELASGGDVRIPGFGQFAVSERAARKGRNPLTGQVIDIPSKKTPKFMPGRTLKDAVGEGDRDKATFGRLSIGDPTIGP